MKNDNSSRVALVDFDGTLFSTKEANFQSYKKALETIGVNDFTREYYYSYCDGRSYRDFLPKKMPTDKLNLIEEVHHKKKEFYQLQVNLIKENRILFAMLSGLKRDGWKLGLVTTASKPIVEMVLEKFKYSHFFDLTITGEDVKKTKPDPEAYLLAMNSFKVSPKDTIIFEDSESGIQAARASGANVFIVDTF